jgi:dolichol-phosphate mannosyltransferase
MRKKKELSIILPVYNEKESLGIFVKVLNSIITFDYEIIIVYDFKKDNTVEEGKKLQKLFKNIKLVHNNLGPGIKNAITFGKKFCNYDNILLTTVDEIFPIIAFDKMLDLIVYKNYDMVSGTRYNLDGRRLGGSFIGKFLSYLANKSFVFLTAFPISDLTTGIKMFKKNILEEISFKNQSNGWVFAFELSIKAFLLNKKIGEIGLLSVDRLFGGASTFRPIPWIKDYFKCYCWGLINIYRKKLQKNNSC